MRRILFAGLVSAAAFAFAIAPASSLARGQHRGEHHRRDRHELRHHHRRHHGVRQVQLGHSPTAVGNSTAAGTIKSFSGGVLTLTLNDGSTVSGTVDGSTEIKCDSPQSMQMTSDDHGPSGGRDQGDQGDQGEPGDDNGNDNGDDNGEDNGGAQMCTTAALTPGAVVQDAELRISSAGSVWEEVELASQQ